LLTPSQAADVDRYRRIEDYNRRLIGRALRQLLVGSVQDGGLDVSTSYAGTLVAYAVALGRVGIDIERQRDDVDWRAIAPLVLGPSELQALGGLPEARIRESVLQAWTRAEALGKLRGDGLTGEARATSDRANAITAAIFPAEHYVGAVAVGGVHLWMPRPRWLNPSWTGTLRVASYSD
jgi:phosphopantetheinyl transferase